MNNPEAEFKYINYLPCPKGFTTETRNFDFPYLLYIHSGKGRFRIGSYLHTCRKGDMLFCPSGTDNTIYADRSEPFVLSGIDFTVRDNSLLNRNMQTCISLDENTFAEELLNMLIKEFLYKNRRSDELCHHLFNSLLLYIIQLNSLQENNKYLNSRSEKIIEYIKNNYNKDLKYENLSKIFNYHRNTIAYTVKKATGMNLRQYIIKLRIQEIKNILIFTDNTLEEISEKTGYSSSSYMCMQFKKAVGETPTAFRNKYRKI